MREYRDPTLTRERLMFDAHHKALDAIADARIDMHLFTDMYTQEAVDRDLAEVERLKTIFRQEETPETKLQKRQADILEAIILEQMELSNWFGENVITRAASEFDDFINGTDMLALFDIEGKATTTTGFAIDVTFSKYTQKKITTN
jgi:hypothetical protein